MKVNIIGKFPGQTVSGIGILPRRGIEMTEAEVQRLLNFSNIRVFDAVSGGLLTKSSFSVKKTVPKPDTTKAKEQPAPVVEQKIEPETPVVTTTPETEIKAEPIPPAEYTAEFKPHTEPEVTVEETAAEEITEEAAPVVEETVAEEKPVEEKPYQKYNKNKGKNNKRRFDNQHTDKE